MDATHSQNLNLRCRILAALVVGVLAISGLDSTALAQGVYPQLPNTQDMRVLETPYYTFWSDVPEANLREVTVRMNTMAQVYIQRTRGFSGTIHNKLPFYLFSTQARYLSAGGMQGSDGQFTGRELMAIAGQNLTANSWHVMQHEGFHQFADAVIGGDLPIWANEGLAEYFGEALYTGDGFVSGVVPPWRLKRLQARLVLGDYMPLDQMMFLSHEQWNAQLALANYDQAWSMVQFLAHGEGGKYQKPFAQFMSDVSAGTPWRNAWANRMGSPENFQKKWLQYWLTLPEKISDPLYLQATAQTFASFIGRAQLQKQTFADWNAFTQAVEDRKLSIGNSDWLPPSLLTEAMVYAKEHGTWSLESPANKPAVVVVTTDDGTRLTAWCVIKRNKVDAVSFNIDTLARDLVQVRQLIDQDKIDQARTLLQKTMKDNPTSPALAEAKALAEVLKK